MNACDDCLRRAHVISLVAPRIEGLLQGPSKRIAEVLALASDDLLEALVPAERLPEAVEAVADFDPACGRADAAAAGLEVLCRHADVYPDALRSLRDGPPAIWARGSVALLGDLAVAIVGSRRASSYGLEVAEEMARALATAGVTVISGMALGIDAAAHRGALRAAERRTVAVLGGGADVVYPRANRKLYEAIAESGVVISEVPPGRRPFRWTFPARNRIMAALAGMTVVVEAADPSGSLITADFAMEMNRAVGAVPGRVTSSTSAGSNRLLREGAAVIRHAGDVLDELFGAGAGDGWDQDHEPALTDAQARVLVALEQGANAGAIAAATAMSAAQVRAVLGQLEMLGVIKPTGIGSYEPRAGRHP
ncbi:MAG: DNA-processing protein DprA [Thermoleophilaceae bacterium]